MRIVVLVNGDMVSKYVATAINQMAESQEVEIPLVIKNSSPGNSIIELVRKAIDKPHWVRIIGGQIIADQIWGTPEYKQPVEWKSIPALESAEVIPCKPIPADGFGQKLPPSVVDKVVEQGDVVLRQGFGIIKGEILTRPEHGVLSYHHGDPREYRGGPPGFWEFIHGRDNGGAMLQRLSDELDGGEVIVYDEVNIRDAHTWREVQRRQYRLSESFLVKAVENLRDSEFDPHEMDLGPIRTAPKLKNYLRYVVKNNYGRLW